MHERLYRLTWAPFAQPVCTAHGEVGARSPGERGLITRCSRHALRIKAKRVVPNLQAADPAASTEFYAEVLGLEPVMDLGLGRDLRRPRQPVRADQRVERGSERAGGAGRLDRGR